MRWQESKRQEMLGRLRDLKMDDGFEESEDEEGLEGSEYAEEFEGVDHEFYREFQP